MPGLRFPGLLVAPGGMFAGRPGAGLAGLSVAVPVPGVAGRAGSKWSSCTGRALAGGSKGVAPSSPPPGRAFAPPSRWAASSLVWPGVRDRWELLPPWPRPPPLPRADWHELCQGGAPPPAFRTDVRSGGGIPNPALTHPSDNAGANPLTKATFQ